MSAAPCTTVCVLDADRRRALRALIEREAAPHLAPEEYSTVARGRDQAYLRWEPNLAADPKKPKEWPPERTWRRALAVDALWSELCALWELAQCPRPPDLALVIRGPIGITSHKDAPVFDKIALSVNLGRAEWFHGGSGWHALADGAVQRFDAKRYHGTRNVDPDRYAIIVWSAKIPLPETTPEQGRLFGDVR